MLNSVKFFSQNFKNSFTKNFNFNFYQNNLKNFQTQIEYFKFLEYSVLPNSIPTNIIESNKENPENIKVELMNKRNKQAKKKRAKRKYGKKISLRYR